MIAGKCEAAVSELDVNHQFQQVRFTLEMIRSISTIFQGVASVRRNSVMTGFIAAFFRRWRCWLLPGSALCPAAHLAR